MPVGFLILKQHNLLVAMPTGLATHDCMLDYFSRVRAHPDYAVGLDRVVDNRNLKELDLNFAQMRNIRANEIRQNAGHHKRPTTCFVTQSDVGYGMARMYQSIAEASGDPNVGVYETLDQALDVLGLGASVSFLIETWAKT